VKDAYSTHARKGSADVPTSEPVQPVTTRPRYPPRL